MRTAERIWSEMLSAKVERNGLLISIGGGTTTDLAGFVASTYKRGIAVAHVPTTVIAMVDAAIGGKTGVNFNGTKNQIGSFHEPIAVGLDSIWLETLPQQHIVSGWMEMVKHALIDGPESANIALDTNDLSEIGKMIRTSASIKERIVHLDYRESGPRKSLNFGHTVGHAIEAHSMATGNHVPHGIAVGYGMIFALIASQAFDVGLPPDQASRAVQRLTHWLAPYPLTRTSPEELWGYMLADKKNKDQKVMDVWLADWGKPIWDQVLNFTDFQRIWVKTTEEIAQ